MKLLTPYYRIHFIFSYRLVLKFGVKFWISFNMVQGTFKNICKSFQHIPYKIIKSISCQVLGIQISRIACEVLTILSG